MATEFFQLFEVLRQATEEALCISAGCHPGLNAPGAKPEHRAQRHMGELLSGALLVYPGNGTWGLAPGWEPAGG